MRWLARLRDGQAAGLAEARQARRAAQSQLAHAELLIERAARHIGR